MDERRRQCRIPGEGLQWNSPSTSVCNVCIWHGLLTKFGGINLGELLPYVLKKKKLQFVFTVHVTGFNSISLFVRIIYSNSVDLYLNNSVFLFAHGSIFWTNHYSVKRVKIKNGFKTVRLYLNLLRRSSKSTYSVCAL